MEVRNLVAGQTVACGRDVSLIEIARLMEDEDVGSVAVVDGAALIGIVTERDLVRALGEDADPNIETAAQWMTADPDVADPDLEVADAARWMISAGYRHLPVVDQNKLIGVVSIKDVLWALDGDLAFGSS